MEVSGQLQAKLLYDQGKNSGTHWMGSWVGPKDGLVRFGEDNNFLRMPGFQTRTIQPVARLLYGIIHTGFTYVPCNASRNS
jgi:hypothetical protein